MVYTPIKSNKENGRLFDSGSKNKNRLSFCNSNRYNESAYISIDSCIGKVGVLRNRANNTKEIKEKEFHQEYNIIHNLIKKIKVNCNGIILINKLT